MASACNHSIQRGRGQSGLEGGSCLKNNQKQEEQNREVSVFFFSYVPKTVVDVASAGHSEIVRGVTVLHSTAR